MGKESGTRERLKWAAGKKPAAMENWSATLARDVRGGLPAYRLGLILPPLFHSTRGICWMTRKRLAETSGVSISSVRDGLRELEELGHIGRGLEVIGGKRKRTIFPTICHEVAVQARRVRRGGVAKGVDPAAIAAEKRRSTPLAAQDGSRVDVIEAERIVPPAVPPAAPERPSAAQHEARPSRRLGARYTPRAASMRGRSTRSSPICCCTRLEGRSRPRRSRLRRSLGAVAGLSPGRRNSAAATDALGRCGGWPITRLSGARSRRRRSRKSSRLR